MHGLINRAIQSFVCQTYGEARWATVMRVADLGFAEFEAMLMYDDDQTVRVMEVLCAKLGRPHADVMEDLGTFLVSHPNMESLRRLLRFGGETYVEFLHSLDDLPDRARLAVSDLHLPGLELREHDSTTFSLLCQPGWPGVGSLMVGVLRTMADDYGTLAILSHEGAQDGVEVISITLIETSFAEGREFDLGARA